MVDWFAHTNLFYNLFVVGLLSVDFEDAPDSSSDLRAYG